MGDSGAASGGGGLAGVASVKAPLQARSQETLDRILEATEALLGEKDLHEITVVEIVERAGSSVGAFYQRFANKDALLPALVARYYAEEAEGVGGASGMWALSAPGAMDGKGLAERAGAVFGAAVRLSRERLGLFRAMAMQRRSPDPSSDNLNAAGAERLFGSVAALLLGCRDEMSCADPETRVTLALSGALLLLQEKLYFPSSPFARVNALDDRELVVELTSMFLAAVGAAGVKGA